MNHWPAEGFLIRDEFDLIAIYIYNMAISFVLQYFDRSKIAQKPGTLFFIDI